MGCAASIHTTDSFVESSDFLFSYCIGKGGFGKVYSCMHIASKEWLAIKEQKIFEVMSHKNGLGLITAELHALRVIGSHPFIVGLHFAFYDTTSCYLGLDLCCGGDLRYHMKKFLFTERPVAFIVMCISSALQHLHEHGVIHRDIKPENIIFNDRGYPLLTDFGVAFIHPSATIYNHNLLSKPDLTSKDSAFICNMSSGTKQYLAPEVFTSSHLHGSGVDYWGLGVTMYELLYGKRPFQRHCPSNMIAFAENNYVISSDISPSQLPLGPSGVLLSGSIVTVDISDAMVPPLSPSSPSPPLLHSPVEYSSLLPPIPSFLQTKIPRFSQLHGDISDPCRAVVAQLLDVRPCYRHTYSTLAQEKWFDNMDLEWSKIERAQIESPFKPDLKQVSLDICTRFMFATEDEEPSNSLARHNLTTSQAAKLDETLKRFQYVSPEFTKYIPKELIEKLNLLQNAEMPTTSESQSGGGIEEKPVGHLEAGGFPVSH